jgi:hypothetical protein
LALRRAIRCGSRRRSGSSSGSTPSDPSPSRLRRAPRGHARLTPMRPAPAAPTPSRRSGAKREIVSGAHLTPPAQPAGLTPVEAQTAGWSRRATEGSPGRRTR